MTLFHDSHDARFRSPFGAAETGSALTLALSVSDAPGCSCTLRLWCGAETLLPMDEAEPGLFRCTFQLPETPGLIWYCFVVTLPGGRTVYYGNAADQLGGVGQTCDTLPPGYQVTVYRPAPVPEWYRAAVVYQIFPDRFCRGSDFAERWQASARPGRRRLLQDSWEDTPFYPRAADNSVSRWPFFGGTLRGIREKLPYLQSLGVTALYLNPIFEAASNHRYDTADYLAIDPLLGDEAEFRALCSDAAAAGIHIILDGVFSHTGADSRYFNRSGTYPEPGAAQSPDSPYFSWYRFTDYPDAYEAWWGVRDLPNVNELEPSYLDFICNQVIPKWIQAGASGWRLDVADELPDAFIKAVRAAVKQADPDALLLGEVWEDASNKVSYGVLREYFLGDELDATMHYPFRTAMLDFFLGRLPAPQLCRILWSLQENYPPANFCAALNLISSHDRPRVLTVLGEAPEHLPEAAQETYRLPPPQRELAVRRLMLLSLLQFASPGVPCIYYGDEAGCEGYADPYNRAPYPWGREDPALMAHYRAIVALRAEEPLLRDGLFTPISLSDDVYGCLRTDEFTEVLTLVNRSRTESFPLPEFGEAVFSVGGGSPDALPPLSAVVLKRRC